VYNHKVEAYRSPGTRLCFPATVIPEFVFCCCMLVSECMCVCGGDDNGGKKKTNNTYLYF